eukprot:GHVU01160628.1.p2 GENE.GHVU01160628.1~~GHVU01160628.1.p2  ORF type:complete len:163 (+),score=29.63 GHVU01160628.1:71-490(+)
MGDGGVALLDPIRWAARFLPPRLKSRVLSSPPDYIPPEAVASRPTSRRVSGHSGGASWTGGDDLSPASDCWAAGAMLFELVSGRPPFSLDSDSHEAALFKVLTQAPALPAGVESTVADVIRGLLAKAPTERMDASEVRE